MDQDREIKKEARRQYFKYFRFWLIGAAAVLLISIFVNVARLAANNRPRGNPGAPEERVYDNAGVLTDEEEQRLREHIAKLEKKVHADLVLVTINESVGLDDYTWEDTMMNIADDFYDNNAYGWNEAYGDGALILDNWYEDEDGSQKGSWLSTSGKMEDMIGAYEEGKVLDRMDLYIDSDPCRAYQAALSALAECGETSSSAGGGRGGLGAMAVSAVIAVIYALVNLRQSKAKDTTTASTYVPEGNFIMNSKSDIFLRKSVTSYRIQSSGGGGGSRSHSGGGSHGSHRSSSGHSHGGGGRRR